MNGKLIRISQDARQKGKLLKRCYHELLETVDAYFLVAYWGLDGVSRE